MSTGDHGEVLWQSLLVPLHLVFRVLAGQRVLVTAVRHLHSSSIRLFLVFLLTIGLYRKPASIIVKIIWRQLFSSGFDKKICYHLCFLEHMIETVICPPLILDHPRRGDREPPLLLHRAEGSQVVFSWGHM